jgi:hypothetical protein
MRRELFVHFSFWFAFFVFVSIFKHFISISHWPLWIGGLVGIFLPDIDHLIYVLFLSPQELTSQRVNFLWNRKEMWRMIQLLYETRSERKGLIFHTIFFQLIFFILTFWLMSSSASIFGKGLALSFSLHLCVDQLVDLMETKSFDNWFTYLPFKLNLSQSKTYLAAAFLLVCVMGFLM